MYGVLEEEGVARHRRSSQYVVHGEAVGQFARTVQLHAIVEDEDTYGCFPVERAVNEGIDHELYECDIGYLQLARAVELPLHLHRAQVASQECHDGVILVQQIALHLVVRHLVDEHISSHEIAIKVYALGSEDRHPSLRILSEEQHCRHSHLPVWPYQVQVAQEFLGCEPFAHQAHHLFERLESHVLFVDAPLGDSRLKAVEQEQFQRLFVEVVDGSVAHGRLVGVEAAALGHHLRELSIVEYLPFVGSVLHPHDGFVVVIGFVQSLLDVGHHYGASFGGDAVYVEQYSWNDVL